MRWADIVGEDIIEDLRTLTQQSNAIKRQQQQLDIRKKRIAAAKARENALRKQRQLGDAISKVTR